VVLTSNAEIYNGKEKGSGKCYLCLSCKSYVGTHEPRPDEAYGILADKEMRILKMLCHELFDRLWQSELQDRKRGKSYFRSKYYGMLAEALNIDKSVCHFGYFDTDMLKRAYEILSNQKLTVSGKKIKSETYFDYYSKTPERLAEFFVVCQSMCDYCIYSSKCGSQQSGATCSAGIASWLNQTREDAAV
jgi:hypothetical protein